MKLLIIEDDKDTAQTLKEDLENYFLVELAHTGVEGEYKAQINEYDLVVLDYHLPDLNGLDVCKSLRENENRVPILVLTGEYDLKRKVSILNSGADDYLTKPFKSEELLARIRAIIRRCAPISTSHILQVGDLILDVDNKLVKRGDKTIQLRRKEFHILEYMMRNKGRVVTREMILNHAWYSESESITNTVDVHIKYLRDHIDKSFDKKLLKTVYGFGYKLDAF